MGLPQTQLNVLPPSSQEAIERVTRLSEEVLKLPQADLPTEHTLHGGMYARTLRMVPGTVCCGAMIKVPTIIIIQGNVIVYTNGDSVELKGYNIFAGSADRKQAVYTLSDVSWTMIFRTDAETVEEAEEEFTNEYSSLMSRNNV